MAEKLPPGFEMCPDQSCPDLEEPVKGAELTYKGKGDPKKKCKSPCGCRFFERPSHMPDSDQWRFVFPDENGKFIAKGRYDYKAFCVKPKGLMPKDQKGKHYTVCSSSGCKLDSETDGTKTKVWCVTPKSACGEGCECVLFRLKKETPRPGNSQEAKWEYVAPAGEKADLDKDYYYECICVKLEDDD